MRLLTTIFILALALAGCSDSSSSKCKSSADCDTGKVCDADTGKCRDALTCTNAGCAAHQLCEEGGAGQDASCLSECEEGYDWNASTSQCDQHFATCEDGVAGSILQDCLDQGRECVEDTPGQAECGDCLDPGQVLDEETGICRAPLTCDDIQCTGEEICVQPPGEDAYCSTECVGPQGEAGLVTEDGTCVICPMCDGPGEDGPFTDSLTQTDECICKTLPGYYWSLAPIGVEPCDQDGDGWVRIGAQTSIEHEDPVIRDNARCSLRKISVIVLTNEAGQNYTNAMSEKVAMYESKRNDDQNEIDGNDDSVPFYSGDRELLAEELNSLTKACVSNTADYNENELEDVNEYHGMDPPPGMNPAYVPFLGYTYFMELHRGWYEVGAATAGTCQTPADCPDGEVCDVLAGGCQEAGIYHIQEKSRLADAEAAWAVPVVQDQADPDNPKGPYWRLCTRKLDSAFNTSPPNTKQGMDFGRFPWDPADADADWFGMNHHSQFKCIKISGSPDQPNEVAVGQVQASGFQLNACVASGSSDPVSGNLNPSDPQVTCAPTTPDGLTDGDVRWAVMDYMHYTGTDCGPDPDTYDCVDSYIRGCVNECDEFIKSCKQCVQTKESCPGYYDDPVKGMCEALHFDFGRLFCGCGTNYAGEECQLACPDSDLLKSADFDIADETTEERRGYWMCGHISSTAYAPDSEPVLSGSYINSSNQEITYRLRGEVPIAPIEGARVSFPGSDEAVCTCAAGEFACDNGTCILVADLCDGADQCGDNSDESSCGLCTTGQFPCRDGTCIDGSLICDGTDHCGDSTSVDSKKQKKKPVYTIRPAGGSYRIR